MLERWELNVFARQASIVNALVFLFFSLLSKLAHAVFYFKHHGLSVSNLFLVPIVWHVDFITFTAYFLLSVAMILLFARRVVVDKFFCALNFLIGVYMLLNLQFYMIFFTDFRFEYAASTVTKSSLGMFFSQALDICSFELLGVGLVVVYVVTRIQGSYLRRFRSGGTLDVHMPSERVILLVGFSYLILIFVLAHGGAEGFYRSVESLFQFRSNPFVELLDSSYSVYFEGSGSGFGRQLRYNGYDSSDYVFLSNIYPLVKASNHLACVHGLSGLDCSVDGEVMVLIV